jgi:hypothetical protein
MTKAPQRIRIAYLEALPGRVFLPLDVLDVKEKLHRLVGPIGQVTDRGHTLRPHVLNIFSLHG